MDGKQEASTHLIRRRATTVAQRTQLEVPMTSTAKKSRSASVVDAMVSSADGTVHGEKIRRRKTDVKHNYKSLRSMIYGFSMTAEREEARYAKLRHRQRVQEEKAMQAVPSAPIDASKFVAYVTERRKKRILFKGEYLMILRSVDSTKCQSDVAQTMGDRNQYADTLPYDYNRVILSRLPNDENSHYVNASYVNSWLRERAYVVTQAVKTKSATADFWRMVWELGSNCIVMLTKVFDFMRVVCLQYWPVTSAEYGDITVETLSTKTYAHFVIRTLRLTRVDADVGQQTRVIKQFHFTEWELDSFPYISAFIELRRRIRRYIEKYRSDAPIIVHCSNGGGRSGAFIALDANLELMKKTDQIDVYEYAKTMVNSRPHLVDSVDQYQFIYDALSEAVLCNIEPIAMWQLKERSSMYKARRDRQLMEAQDAYENKLLVMLTPTLRIGDCAGGHRLENRGKNRDVMVVPPDHARPYLQTLHGESKDYTYINAVEVDGFTRKNEFIVTEWPKLSTIDSFWTLVFDHSCHTIVNLSNQGNSRTYPTFLHSKGKRTYGPFVVEILNYHQYPSMTSHMVKVMKKPEGYFAHSHTHFFRHNAVSPTQSTFTVDHRNPYDLERNNAYSNLAPGESFKLQHIYRGRIRRQGLATGVDTDETSKCVSETCTPQHLNATLTSNNYQLNSLKSSDGVVRQTQSEEKLLVRQRRRSTRFGSMDPYHETFMISEIMASGANQQQLEAEVRICCVIQVRMWPIENKVPLSTSGLIDMIKMARSWRKRAPDRPETKPTIVMSHNGVSRCGIFIAANVCIDQMNMDHEVDVFHTVKMIRINRPQLIDMKDEYKYLYDLMLHWYMTNPEYRRFDEENEDSSRSGAGDLRSNVVSSGNSSLRRNSRSPRAVADANHVL